MLDLQLFRGAGFVGAQIAAFAISASIFAAFLYLTLYLQNVLGYSPLEAGLRFLPLSLAAFVVAAISGNLTSRVSARWLMGAGLAIIGVSLLLMARIEVGLGVDDPAARVRAWRDRDRAHEPGARLDRRGRRPAGAVGHGVRHEQHLPPGRDRDRHRRPRGAVPAHDLHEADDAERGCTRATTSSRPWRRAPSRAGSHRRRGVAFVDSLGSILTIAAIVSLAGAALVIVLLRDVRPPPTGAPQDAPAG